MGQEYSYYSTIVWVIFNHCLECVTVVGVVPLTSAWLKSSNTCDDLNTKSSQKPASSTWLHELLGTPEPNETECRLYLDTLSWIVMFVTMPVVGLLTSPFVGWMCDRYGAVRIQIVASGIMVMTNCLYAFSDRFEVVILARAINGVGTSLILSSECAFILNQSPSEKVKNKTVFGLYCASGMEYIGITFIGVLFEAIGQAIPFLLVAVGFLVSAIMLTCSGLPRNQVKKRNISNNNNNMIELNVTPNIQENSSGGFMILLRDRKILIAAYLTFASTIPRASLLSVYGIWASEEFGATVKEYSLAWLPSGCFYIAIHILGIFMIVNYSKHSWILAMISLFIGESLTLVVPWTLSLVTSMFPLAFSISFGSLCRTMVIADITSYSKRKFPSLSGRVSGLIMFSGYFIPYILGPIQAILFINSSYGLVAATILSSIISFLALPLTPLLRNHTIEPEEIPLLQNSK